MPVFLLVLATGWAAATTAQDSAIHFSHTLETTALPARIWAIWADVPRWPRWDQGLKAAELDGIFRQGATGHLFPARGGRSRFVITELVQGRSYTFRTRLPLGALYVKRTLSAQNGRTTFTHEVWFTGLSKGVFSRVLGQKYRQILPEVMVAIKIQAEQTTDAD